MNATDHSSADTSAPLRVDAVIAGGGVAGLWLLNLLTARGYNTLLLEADRLGACQTLASQGMIHGGLKYALAGRLNRASEAISRMPDRWSQCLAGRGPVDLQGLAPLSDRYYMFAAASTLGQLTGFFASRALRGRIRKLAPAAYPPPFAEPGFDGVVYALEDFVLDTPALLHTLLAPVRERAYRWRLAPEHIETVDTLPARGTAGRAAEGSSEGPAGGSAEGAAVDAGVTLRLGACTVAARRLILAAGAGTQPLLDALNIADPVMQLRPLNQVLVRHDYPHPVYAHCLTGIRRAEPRLTITSHPDGDGWLWYLGGQLATDGAAMNDAQLREHARAELQACLPWLDWSRAELATLRVDRAEPAQQGGRRPDEAYAAARGAALVTWPTKLSLTPDLGDKVLGLLPPPAHPTPVRLPLPLAEIGQPPWVR